MKDREMVQTSSWLTAKLRSGLSVHTLFSMEALPTFPIIGLCVDTHFPMVFSASFFCTETLLFTFWLGGQPQRSFGNFM
jgi:hypothetical protein